MNRTIKLLILSDIFVVTGFGLIDPILAIFINDKIIGGTIFTAGIASSLFWIVKSLFQLPVSKYVDKHGFNYSIKLLIGSTFFISLVPILYIFSKHINLIFLAQIIHGLASGLAYPAWLGIWSTHLDKGKESYEWSMYSTLVSVGTAISGAIGAAVAEFIGFTMTFILVGLVSLVGCLILINLTKKKLSAN